ncbi:MAG: yedA [Solirubrobacterales bacterium]|nr:yedA [Solirubrobacterales bacterium]
MTRAGHADALPPQWQVWSALVSVYVIWGSTYLAIRVMVRDVPPLLGAGARFLVAGAVMLAVLRARGRRARPRRRELGSAALVGVLLAAGGNGLVTVAEQDVPSGLAALLIASVPLWVVILRSTAGRERVAPATLAGVAVGFAGLGVLLLPGGRPAGATTAGVLLVLVAALSWALGSFASPRLPLPRDPLVSTAWQMVSGGVVMLAAGLAAGETRDVNLGGTSLDSALAFAYLVAAGSWVAFTAYAWLLQHAPLSQVATYAYVNPLVAVLLGWAILGEQLTTATLAGAGLVVASVAAIVTREAAKAPAPAPAPTRIPAVQGELLDETRPVA